MCLSTSRKPQSNRKATAKQPQSYRKATAKQPQSNRKATAKLPQATAKKMTHLFANDMSKENKIRNIVYINWLDGIKKNGVDEKGRVPNPICIGRRISTRTKEGIYPKLYNWCIDNLRGYDFRGIPIPESTKRCKVLSLIIDANNSNNTYIEWLYIEWLDEIKKNGTDMQCRVRNPLYTINGSGRKYISTSSKDGIYPKLYKWCIENLPSYDMVGIPLPMKMSTKI
jgi:hypothetical protein